MTMKNTKKTTALIAALLALTVSSANALTEVQTDSISKMFNKVPVAEVSGKAAQFISQTPASDKEEVAVAVVRTVLAKNPTVAATLISSIVTVAPEVAPAVVAEAVSNSKPQAEAIAIAAAKAAPNYSERICQSVAEVVPSSADTIQTRVRTSLRNAATPVSGATIIFIPGVTRGIAFTPFIPPTTPPRRPVIGFDQNRYQAK